MGNSEDGKSIKTERPSSPVTTDQTDQANPSNMHVYPDWAAMQVTNLLLSFTLYMEFSFLLSVQLSSLQRNCFETLVIEVYSII